jgi:hypothetical protein
MEDIVAVRVSLDTGDLRYFLTWGRIHHPVDPERLEALILAKSPRFSLGGRPVAAHLCETLQEAATQPYFFEYFFAMCQKKIPFGPKYGQWADRTRKLMEDGKEMCFPGSP